MSTTYTDTSYRKINYTSGRSEWGAWVGTGYGRSAIAKPVVGDAIQIRTKAGEIHTRTIKRIVEEYKSGVLVSLVPDEQVAATAKSRYDAKVAESTPARRSPLAHGKPISELSPVERRQCEREYDRIHNEGGEGFNPYRD